MDLSRPIIEWIKRVFGKPAPRVESSVDITPQLEPLVELHRIGRELDTANSLQLLTQISNLIGYVAGLKLAAAMAQPQTLIASAAIPAALTASAALPKTLTASAAVPATLTASAALPKTLTAGAVQTKTLKTNCKKVELELEKLNDKFPEIKGQGEIKCKDKSTPYFYEGEGIEGLHSMLKLQLNLMKKLIAEVCLIADEFDDTIAGEIELLPCDDDDTIAGSIQSFGETEQSLPSGSTASRIIYQGKGIKGLSNKLSAALALSKKMREQMCECEGDGGNEDPIIVMPDGRKDWKLHNRQLQITLGEAYPYQYGSLWRIHVPSPKSGLSWGDFEDLSILCGSRSSSVYARVAWLGEFSEIPTCGWFLNKDEAERVLRRLIAMSTIPVDSDRPIRYTEGGKNRRLRESPFTIRAVRAAIVDPTDPANPIIQSVWRPPGAHSGRGRPLGS